VTFIVKEPRKRGKREKPGKEAFITVLWRLDNGRESAKVVQSPSPLYHFSKCIMTDPDISKKREEKYSAILMQC